MTQPNRLTLTLDALTLLTALTIAAALTIHNARAPQPCPHTDAPATEAKRDALTEQIMATVYSDCTANPAALTACEYDIALAIRAAL